MLEVIFKVFIRLSIYELMMLLRWEKCVLVFELFCNLFNVCMYFDMVFECFVVCGWSFLDFYVFI